MSLLDRFLEFTNAWERSKGLPYSTADNLLDIQKQFINITIANFIASFTLEDIAKFCKRARERELYRFLTEQGMNSSSGLMDRAEDVASIVEKFYDNPKLKKQALVLHYMKKGQIYDTDLLKSDELDYVIKNSEKILKYRPPRTSWYFEEEDDF